MTLEVIKLYINGEDSLIKNDRFGKKINYQKCKELKTKQCFLNIWNLGKYFFGVYDIWNSKNGDILSIENSEGRILFEFKENRYWQVRDYVAELSVIKAFEKMYPDAKEIEIEQHILVANFNKYIAKFEYFNEDKDISFKEISRKDIIYHNGKVEEQKNAQMPTPCIQEDTDGEFKCKRKCYFSSNGICKYFDWELESPSGEIPDCKEPFIYIEQIQEQLV
ncbi:MAG: hypothetical protein K0R54_210 [Clostridiaceae bacterium]|jgi:hypothetical protein|nr:hypothetical protein [Clostridiaceae bacterium]